MAYFLVSMYIRFRRFFSKSATSLSYLFDNGGCFVVPIQNWSELDWNQILESSENGLMGIRKYMEDITGIYSWN